MKKHIANIITAARIPLSLELLLTEPLTAPFYIVYIILGITDMADGHIARRLGTESRLGARLDSVADIVFLAVCLIKLISVISLPRWAVILFIIVALIRLVNIIIGIVMCKGFVSLHTLANKLTGLLLFIWPLSFGIVSTEIACVILCIMALFASVQETVLILKGRFD